MLKNISYPLFLVMFLFIGSYNILSADTLDTVNSEMIDEDMDDFDNEFEEMEETTDLLSEYNIIMTSFNDVLYVNVIKPMVQGYNYIAPLETRIYVDNFFHNLMYPSRLVNNILQGKIGNATEETGRFVINTTLGLFGFFDTAKKDMEWEAHDEDFGQTLGYWGFSSGYHIVLPFLGPSNIRDIFGISLDSLVNPMVYNYDRNYNLLKNSNDSTGLILYEKLNSISLHLEEYELLKEDAVDLYPFLKDIYEQRREQLIKE